MRTSRWLSLSSLLALVFVANGCAFAPSGSSGSVGSPPDDFYQPPAPLQAAPPGTLIWAEEVDGLELTPPARVWRILYHSRDEQNRDIPVSGFAIVPSDAAPDDGRDVYAWGHGTVGLGDQCAPSHEIRDNLPAYGGQQVERGTVLVATDYQGLGTPGVPTHANGIDEGRAILDSVRAVQSLPGVGAIDEVVLAGHSQGGQAVLFAGEIAPRYAPELKLVGIVALAAGVELPDLTRSLAQGPLKGAVLIGAAGLRAAYPDVDLSAVLTPAAIADLPLVESECVDDTIQRYEEVPIGDVFIQFPDMDPEINQLLTQNSPGSAAIAEPVFLGHGTADEQVPIVLTEQVLQKYCALGVHVTRHTYESVDHMGVLDAAADDVLAFISAS